MENRVKSSDDGGDFLPHLYPDLAAAIAKQKYEEAEETRAEVLLTSCLYARDNLTKAAKNNKLRVMDLGEFLLKYLVS